MHAKGEFVFKALEHRDGGEFTNEKGQVIKYQACYILKLDEVRGSEIIDVKFKIDKTFGFIIDFCKNLKPYTKIKIDFAVDLKNSNIKFVPTDIAEIKEAVK